MAESIFHLGDVNRDISLLNDAITKLNSNLSSLKIWVGTASFVFANTDNATVNVADICNVPSSSIVGLSCCPTGYARATFGMDSPKAKIIMQAHQVYSTTISVMVILYYT